ncbi:MAG: MFS transporter [Anaerolineaceae bacterium]|nr:MFS transporter [Anaerolineaceae bacterium]
MKRINKLALPPSFFKGWQGFLTYLVSILVIAIGEGGYLMLIIAYMENKLFEVNRIGMISAFLSVIEGAACLMIGHYYKGRKPILVTTLFAGMMAVSTFFLFSEPVGTLVWISAGLNGLGMGVVSVVVYVTALENRPDNVNLGLAVGLYTAFIAAGNAIGSVIGGIIVDHAGYAQAFIFCGIAMASTMIIVNISRVKPRKEENTEVNVNGADAQKKTKKENDGSTAGRWKYAIVLTVILATLISVYATLFPIYGLRSGLSMTQIGTLSGAEMMTASIIRPFSGAILARLDVFMVTVIAVIAVATSSALIPVLGLGVGLIVLMILLGLSFGTSRVSGATLVMDGSTSHEQNSKRISYYNTALTMGQVVGPWLGGVTAAAIGISMAMMLIPAGCILVGILSILMLNFVSKKNDGNRS